MTDFEAFLTDSDKRVALRRVLEGPTMKQALDLLKDMHRPGGAEVYSADGNHLVRAAAIHDYEAGWHDCLRALQNLTIAPTKQTIQSLVPFDDDYVRKAMKELGKPLYEEPKKKAK